MWQDAQLGFTAGARENGRPRNSPRPGDIKIHLQQQQEKMEHQTKEVQRKLYPC